MSEDIWESVMHQASYGGIPLDILTTSNAASRALARYKYPYVDGQRAKDMGGEPHICRARLIFVQRPGSGAPNFSDDDPMQRFRDFLEMKDSGVAQRFSHPIEGSFKALISDCTWNADAEPRDTIYVDCTFEEVIEQDTAFTAGPGTPDQSSISQIEADASSLSDATADAGVETTVGSDVVNTVHDWEDAARGPRDINLELVSLSNKIDAEYDRLEVATNVRRYPIMTSLISLRSNLRKAAATFQQKHPRLISITVTSPTPLLVIAARTYGGEQATARASEMQSLNDIPNPARVERGRVLRAHAPGTSLLRSPQ